MEDSQNIPEENLPSGEALSPKDTASPPGIIIQAADLQSHQPPTQSHAENMEIHHPTIHHKKRWKDYMFEFFMLFLAVSSGFFVENLREHYVEHERAREYAAMLRKDLEADTTIINIIINFRIEQRKDFDSLIYTIKKFPLEKIDQQQFLRLVKSTGQYLHLLSNNGTLQQLKSSGSLRYFKDTVLVYALTSYEEDLKHADYVQNEESQYCSEKVIPFKINHFNETFKDSSVSVVASQNFPANGLIGFDKNTMMEFYNLLTKCAWYNEVLGYNNFSQHKKKAAYIMNLLEQDYKP